MLRSSIALCALLFVSSVLGETDPCKGKCCVAKNGGPPAPPECQSKCAGVSCGVSPFGCRPKLCCEENPPPQCTRICKVIALSCKCTADDCCKSVNIRPSCRKFCSTVDCPPPPPPPPVCPDTRLCCLKDIPLSCKETCKFVKPDCRCIRENCCFLAPGCDAGICAAVTCPAPPPPALPPPRPMLPIDFPPIPSPTDNGGCNTSNCCPPRSLPPGCSAGICAAVTCAALPPVSFPTTPSPGDNGGCNTSNCCPPRSLPPGCSAGICAAVSCAALPPVGFPTTPSPGDNGGCNTSNCCPPRSLPPGCSAGICAAVSCVLPTPPGCNVQLCCKKDNPMKCNDFCMGVDCDKPCCSKTLSPEVDPDDVGCRRC